MRLPPRNSSKLIPLFLFTYLNKIVYILNMDKPDQPETRQVNINYKVSDETRRKIRLLGADREVPCPRVIELAIAEYFENHPLRD